MILRKYCIYPYSTTNQCPYASRPLRAKRTRAIWDAVDQRSLARPHGPRLASDEQWSIWYFMIHVFWCDKVGIDTKLKKDVDDGENQGILVSTVIVTANWNGKRRWTQH